MSSRWVARLRGIGLTDTAARDAAPHFSRCALGLGAEPGSSLPAWWVPGRIEVLGKHTDYGGGRSLLCTVERGFHIMARPRTDGVVQLLDAASRRPASVPVSADAPARPGQWINYPVSVVRRLVRDAGITRGADIAFSSSLPRASGLSSSSAFVIGCYLALANANELDSNAAWQAALPTPLDIAGYLGAVENGKAFGAFPADRGVGTHGGSQDHTAILCCEAGMLSQFRFLPVEHQRTVPLPDEWIFAVAMSGVRASKSAGAKDRYNALAMETSALVDALGQDGDTDDRSLLRRMEAGAMLPASATPALHRRLDQFRAESLEIIPEVTRHLAAGRVEAIAPLIARSQQLADTVLGNQVPETRGLVESALRLGAVASSAFGAGFGGSVWAIIHVGSTDAFLKAWESDHSTAHPQTRTASAFFVTRPGAPARQLAAD